MEVDGVRQLVRVDGPGQGVRRTLIHLGDEGRGVNRQIMYLRSVGQGVNGRSAIAGREGVYVWMRALAERFAHVRVCCGDWSRVCGPSVTVKHGLTAVFLDPPYGDKDRDGRCYGQHDSYDVSSAVREWCIQWQDDPRMRIALCGYEGEHDLPGWECVGWRARGGYAVQARNHVNNNRHRERIWFSPHCLPAERDGIRRECLFF